MEDAEVLRSILSEVRGLSNRMKEREDLSSMVSKAVAGILRVEGQLKAQAKRHMELEARVLALERKIG